MRGKCDIRRFQINIIFKLLYIVVRRRPRSQPQNIYIVIFYSVCVRKKISIEKMFEFCARNNGHSDVIYVAVYRAGMTDWNEIGGARCGCITSRL